MRNLAPVLRGYSDRSEIGLLAQRATGRGRTATGLRQAGNAGCLNRLTQCAAPNAGWSTRSSPRFGPVKPRQSPAERGKIIPAKQGQLRGSLHVTSARIDLLSSPIQQTVWKCLIFASTAHGITLIGLIALMGKIVPRGAFCSRTGRHHV